MRANRVIPHDLDGGRQVPEKGEVSVPEEW